MCNRYKVLSVLITALLYGCTGNSGSSKTNIESTLKRFSGVVNNSSVMGVEVAAISIGKHGQFTLGENGEVEALTTKNDENGRYYFNIDESDGGPYVITVTTPEFGGEAESSKAAKSSCQLVSGCGVSGAQYGFGEYFNLAAQQQWSAVVDFVSQGQFIVINPITEMARALGFTIYKNDSIETDTTPGTTPTANYYSNYAIVKGNSQTASILGIGDILSREPANLALLHTLDTNNSTAIEESIRYGALLAAWQKLELDYNNKKLADDFTFQQEVIYQFLTNQGQIYQKDTSGMQVLTLAKWYDAAEKNLQEVRSYHGNLNRSVPNEIALVIERFQREIKSLKDGELSAGVPVINQQYVDDYTDAVAKTKAMVNYLSNLQSNFATEEYRSSIKASSDLITTETRRLSPSFDLIFQKILSVHQYYLSCTHGSCDPLSEWHSANGSAGNNFIASENKLTIIKLEGSSLAGTNLVISQGLVFDDLNPEGSIKANTHDLFLSGVLEFDGLRLELSDYTAEGAEGIKSSLRFSFPRALEKLPLPPALIEGGKGLSIDEELLPDYIELVMPNLKMYDSLQVGKEAELRISGSLTALMIANTDVGDFLKDDIDKLGKRYNLSSVKATLTVSGQDKKSGSTETELRDNALFFLEASASESFVSGQDYTAYFPDTVYPTFEAFFKPREGFDVGSTSPFPLVVSRRGEMNFPKIDSEGEVSETEVVKVRYIEFDYEIGGAERYVVYDNLDGDDGYWGLVCSVQPEDEALLDGANGDYLVPVFDEDGNPVKDAQGNDIKKALLACPLRDKYTGIATPDHFVNQIYKVNESGVSGKDILSLREFNGHGAYRVNYPTTDGALNEFPQYDQSYWGTLEKPIVLGVDSMRLQFKPTLVNEAGSAYLPESVLDISLVWRTHDQIDVNALLAFNPEQVINNPNGSGLPYLAVGADSESYSIAYRTDTEGNESGEFVMAWAGVNFVDGPVKGSQIMQKTDDEDLKDGVFAGIGSNVSYSPYSKRELEKLGSVDGSDISEEKCGFFSRGLDPTAGEDCDAIAYLTFRGLVTGSLREERDGVYVIRYIDGTWQVLGAK